MATPSFTGEEILDFIDEWSDNTNDCLSSGEEEHLDHEVEGSGDDLRYISLYL